MPTGWTLSSSRPTSGPDRRSAPRGRSTHGAALAAIAHLLGHEFGRGRSPPASRPRSRSSGAPTQSSTPCGARRRSPSSTSAPSTSRLDKLRTLAGQVARRTCVLLAHPRQAYNLGRCSKVRSHAPGTDALGSRSDGVRRSTDDSRHATSGHLDGRSRAEAYFLTGGGRRVRPRGRRDPDVQGPAWLAAPPLGPGLEGATLRRRGGRRPAPPSCGGRAARGGGRGRNPLARRRPARRRAGEPSRCVWALAGGALPGRRCAPPLVPLPAMRTATALEIQAPVSPELLEPGADARRRSGRISASSRAPAGTRRGAGAWCGARPPRSRIRPGPGRPRSPAGWMPSTSPCSIATGSHTSSPSTASPSWRVDPDDLAVTTEWLHAVRAP